jgi:multidrug transporter EmrE-like cation transporter
MLLASVVLASIAQVLLKIGMSSASLQAPLNRGEPLRAILAIAGSPFVLGGLVTFAVSVFVWLLVLSRISLSSAYPFVALGIVITVLAGRFILGEPVSLLKLVGITMIIGGVLTMAIAERS